MLSATQSPICLRSFNLRPLACPASMTACACSCRIPLNDRAVLLDQIRETCIKETDNYGRKNICNNQWGFAKGKFAVKNFLNGANTKDQFLTHMIGICIFARILYGTGIYIHAQRGLCSQLDRRDGKNPGATADIDNFYVILSEPCFGERRISNIALSSSLRSE